MKLQKKVMRTCLMMMGKAPNLVKKTMKKTKIVIMVASMSKASTGKTTKRRRSLKNVYL
jgi:hypothetical protein